MNYLAIRTSKDHRAFIWSELQQGRLRQGWGSSTDMDLRRLLKKRRARGEFTPEESMAWRNRRLLSDVWDGLQEGDFVLLPNLPEQGKWVLARVRGAYSFEIAEGMTDFGHLLPVEPYPARDGGIAVIDPRHPAVDARLRGSMRNMSRMWSLDRYAPAIDKLGRQHELGEDLGTGQSRSHQRANFLSDVNDAVSSLVWTRLSECYRGAEFEVLLEPLLESVYGSGNVRRIGGPKERGADLLVTTRGPLGLEFKVAIQVKMYDGTLADLHPIRQLKWARDEHGVQAGVILTTAASVSEDVQMALTELRDELRIDVQVWSREDFVRLLLGYLGKRHVAEA